MLLTTYYELPIMRRAFEEVKVGGAEAVCLEWFANDDIHNATKSWQWLARAHMERPEPFLRALSKYDINTAIKTHGMANVVKSQLLDLSREVDAFAFGGMLTSLPWATFCANYKLRHLDSAKTLRKRREHKLESARLRTQSAHLSDGVHLLEECAKKEEKLARSIAKALSGKSDG